MNRRTLSAFLFAVLLPSGSALAQARVSATVDSTEIGIDDSLTLTVRVEGQVSNVSSPNLPPMDDFRVSGPSTSFSRQMVNFTVTQSWSYAYALTPRKKGELRIPSVSVTVDGRVYATEPLLVNVKEGSLRPQRRAPSQPSLWDPFGVFGPPPQQQSLASEEDIEKNVFIEAEATKTSFYVGEATLVSYALFSRYPILQVAYDGTPTFDGCMAQELSVLKQDAPDQVTRNGEPFYRVRLMQFLVTPSMAGARTISPLRMQMELRVDEPFGFFPVRGSRTLRKASPALTLHARPLPEPIPEGFSGAVGRFTMTARPPKSPLGASDMDSLTLVIKGKGSLGSARPPEFPEVAGLTVHPPESKLETAPGRPLENTLELRYPVAPRLGGMHRLPPLRFTYFDPSTGTYETLSSDAYTLMVEGSPAGTMPLPAAPGAISVRAAENGPVFYEPFPVDPESLRPSTLPRRLALAAAGLPMLWTLGLAVSALRRRFNLDERLGIGTSPKRLAMRALERAHQSFRRKEPEKALAEIHAAWTIYLSARLRARGASLTASDAERLLSGRGAPEDLRQACREAFQKIDGARYSPFGAEEGIALVFRLRHLIKRLEKL
jgi:hypothetical protein